MKRLIWTLGLLTLCATAFAGIRCHKKPPVPEPASLIALAIGGATFVRRRKLG
jgi:hypothetical protein